MVKPALDPPIRVFRHGKYWRVDYGSYMDGFYATHAEATAKATEAATREHRELEIEATNQARKPSAEITDRSLRAR